MEEGRKQMEMEGVGWVMGKRREGVKGALPLLVPTSEILDSALWMKHNCITARLVLVGCKLVLFYFCPGNIFT